MDRNPDWNVFLNMAALSSTTLSTALKVLPQISGSYQPKVQPTEGSYFRTCRFWILVKLSNAISAFA